MDIELEINSLKAETFAVSVLLGYVMMELARAPAVGHERMQSAFDNAAKLAEQALMKHASDARWLHAADAGRIIEQLRAQMVEFLSKAPKG